MNANVVTLVPLLALVAAQDILTGIFGAPSIIATVVASRALSTRRALILSTLAQLIGPFLFGVAVAKTVGSQVIEPLGITTPVLAAALLATVVWMLVSWVASIPSSSTHALIGGLVGAVLAAVGPGAVHWDGLLKMVLTLTLTAPLGVVIGYVIARVCYRFARRREAEVDVTRRFNQGQLVAATFLGLAVGSSNAQNAMGVTVLTLMSAGVMNSFEVPVWVIVVSAICLALGNLIGGTRLLNTVGTQYVRVEPLHGFSGTLSSSLIILAASIAGGGVSTTHVTSMSIIGAGAAESVSAVRWRFVRRVLVTWVITIPATAALASLAFGALSLLG